MEDFKSLKSALFDIGPEQFESYALRLFKFQATNNEVYCSYLTHLEIDPQEVASTLDIPCLPIQFFKSQRIMTGDWEEQKIFRSSGTTGKYTSNHYIEDVDFYQQVSRHIFEHFYGPLDQYHILALLPSYLERQDSSLVAMLHHFIQSSTSAYSNFYLYNQEELIHTLHDLLSMGVGKIMLWGVSFALLELAERYALDLSGATVITTGGMKGRRDEITFYQLENYLKQRWRLSSLHAEYGMTELLSQAYAKKAGRFCPPPWMRIFIRDSNDPFSSVDYGHGGGVNIFDLANIHSCAFIETEDLGMSYEDGSFEIYGRMDNTDIRGCNLMVSSL